MVNSFWLGDSITIGVMAEDIIRYESGHMHDGATPLEEQTELIDFFQKLVDTKLILQLQGSYGRTAADLIRLGLVHKEER
jgi:phosphopantetheine adenylyltransferase